MINGKYLRWFQVHVKSQPNTTNDGYPDTLQFKLQEKNEGVEWDETNKMNEMKIHSQDKNQRISPLSRIGYRE